jgi:hypothetical protein
VSLATETRQYPASLKRLEESLRRTAFAGELMFWAPGQFPHSAPTHLQVPFAFKPHCLIEARQGGSEFLLWLDSSCIAVRSLDPIFDQMDRDGYILFKNLNYRLGDWASDDALHVLGVDREEAMKMSEVNGAAFGLSMKSDIATEFLNQWHRAAKDEVAFRGVVEKLRTWEDYEDVKWNRGGKVSRDPRVRGHRHDQTVAGVLAAKLGMKLTIHGLGNYSSSRKIIKPKTRIVIDRDASSMDVPLASLRKVQWAALRGVVQTRLLPVSRPIKRALRRPGLGRRKSADSPS